MGLGRTCLILGLIGGVACLASAMPQGGDAEEQKLIRSGGSTYLSNGAGQIIKGPNGKTILIGSDGRQIVADSSDSDEDVSLDDGTSGNNVIINGGQSSIITSNGRTHQYATGNINYSTHNGHSVTVVNGVITLTEGGKQYRFEAQPAGVEKRETIDINGKPATVQYSNGDVIVELADQTVIAKVGDSSFIGDRQSFENRDKLQAEALQQAQQIQQQVQEDVKRMMQNLNEELQRTLGNIRF
ncbi:uncharacterized protein LOC117892306 [Drosophila subobscura]|uniref:uncharacterized protein LOC117892306 n=1 Tax=Drosophila subobscura TaxID=7241 RepID=UPI00155A13FB|nr:uncharacterized protein LOC117892306 [Drosophila subobscura]